MAERIEFRLSGSGGQGVISAGIILASAAVLDGRHAIQSQSYGPEARGGASRAEVIISDETIDYPKATIPDYLLCLTNESFRLYGRTADSKTVVFVDDSLDTSDYDRPLIRVPITKTARELNPQGANVVAVGFLAGYTGIVSRQSLIDALVEQFPRFVDKNMKCVEAGFAFAKTLK